MAIDTRNRRAGPWDSLKFIIDSINGLENTNVKCTWFESVASGLSGTITPPTGGTILLDEWSAGVDVLVSKIDTGVPTFEPVLDDEGAVITGTLDASGNWTISGTPHDGYPIALIYVYRVALENFNSVYCLSAAQIEGIDTLSFLGNLTDNITGFTDEGRAQSTIAFDEGTLTFTITPVGDKFSVWVLGKEFVYTSAETKVISSTEGSHWIYFDSTGTIQELVNPTEAQEKTAILQYGLITQILIDNASQEIYFADERHGVSMSGWTHLYLHETIGFKYYEGLNPGNLQVDGSGNDNASAVMSLTDGELFDEDIKYETSDSPQTLAPIARIPVYYIDGVAGSWRKDTATDYPVKRFGTSRLAYNSYSAPTYSQTEVTNNNFVLCHIFATNDIDEPIIAVQGLEGYANAVQARIGAKTEITFINTDGLPGHEYTALFTFIYQTSDSYSNAVQAKIVSTDTGDDYVDWRQTVVSSGSGSGGGDVTGPGTATDNAMALFDGVTGKVIKNSALTVTSGVIAGTGLALTTPIINTILSAATKNGITIAEDGAVTLYFNELVKLATTATGATITGELVAGQVTGLNAPDAAGEAVRTTTNITEVNLLALTGGGETALHSHALSAGDVVGPGSSVDNAIALFNSTTGKLIKESALTITSGVIAGVGLALTSPIINTILTAATKTGATFAEDGAATIYYNEVEKFATTATGATITGELIAGQVTGLNAPDGLGEAVRTTTNITEVNLLALTGGSDTTLHDHDGISENTAHRTSDGSDHTYIDQSVVSGATPTFTATNISGIPMAGILAADKTGDDPDLVTGTAGDSLDLASWNADGDLVGSGKAVSEIGVLATEAEWTAQQNFNEAQLTSTSNAVAWNANTAQCAYHTMSENTTVSAPSNLKAGSTYVLRVIQAASYTLAWNSVFKFGTADSSEPAANGDVVIFSFYSDGTNMYAVDAVRVEA